MELLNFLFQSFHIILQIAFRATDVPVSGQVLGFPQVILPSLASSLRSYSEELRRSNYAKRGRGGVGDKIFGRRANYGL